MPFSTDIELERTDHLSDDRMLFEMTFRLIGHDATGISATLETQFYKNPVVIMADNALGLHPVDEDALVLAVYSKMRRYFHAGPSTGDIWWVRWMEPDLEPWVRASLKRSAADRIITRFGEYVDPAGPPRIARSYTESAEG